MSTISDKLNRLAQYKIDIKNSIINKGVIVNNNMSTYSNAIDQIKVLEEMKFIPRFVLPVLIESDAEFVWDIKSIPSDFDIRFLNISYLRGVSTYIKITTWNLSSEGKYEANATLKLPSVRGVFYLDLNEKTLRLKIASTSFTPYTIDKDLITYDYTVFDTTPFIEQLKEPFISETVDSSVQLTIINGNTFKDEHDDYKIKYVDENGVIRYAYYNKKYTESQTGTIAVYYNEDDGFNVDIENDTIGHLYFWDFEKDEGIIGKTCVSLELVKVDNSVVNHIFHDEDPLTFVAMEDNCELSFDTNNPYRVGYPTNMQTGVVYKTYNSNGNIIQDETMFLYKQPIHLNKGEYVELYSTTTSYLQTSNTYAWYRHFLTKGLFDCGGDLTSIEINRITTTSGKTYPYAYLFSGTSILHGPHFKNIKILTSYCFKSMFEGCYNLQETPEFAESYELETTTTNAIADSMFKNSGIKRITNFININSIYGSSDFIQMFFGCTNLIDVSNITITVNNGQITNGINNFNQMFSACSNLVIGPNLNINCEGMTGGSNFTSMFAYSTSLRNINCNINANTLGTGTNNFYQMFYGCISLEDAEISVNINTVSSSNFAYMCNGCRMLKKLTLNIETANYTYFASILNAAGDFGSSGIVPELYVPSNNNWVSSMPVASLPATWEVKYI